MKRPGFFYFDLGMVLVEFSVETMIGQMAEVSGVEPGRVERALFESDLLSRYEVGALSDGEFHEEYCRRTDSRPGHDALLRAGSDIFDLNLSMVPVVSQLAQAGHRLGILSNTCRPHWEHCRSRYRIIGEGFSVHALSYQMQTAKPSAAIFAAAAEMAGVEPAEVFYIDDVPGHVAGARAVGFDAVQYTTTPSLVAELRKRGVRFNY